MGNIEIFNAFNSEKVQYINCTFKPYNTNTQFIFNKEKATKHTQSNNHNNTKVIKREENVNYLKRDYSQIEV